MTLKYDIIKNKINSFFMNLISWGSYKLKDSYASDRLIAYGVLVFVITLIINALYILYCRRHYKNDDCCNVF